MEKKSQGPFNLWLQHVMRHWNLELSSLRLCQNTNEGVEKFTPLFLF